jgi:hypothetical protein
MGGSWEMASQEYASNFVRAVNAATFGIHKRVNVAAATL